MNFLPIAVIALLLSFNTFGQHHDEQIKKTRASLRKAVLYPENKSLFRVNQEFKEKLDSIIYENFEEDYKSRIRIEYDNDWKVKTAYYDVLTFTTAKWFTEAKMEYVYNRDGKVIEIIDSWKDDDRTPWYYDTKYSFTYTSKGHIDTETTYRWDEDEETWQKRYQTENVYKSNGNLGFSYEYRWNKDNSKWEQSYYSDFTYNTDGFVSKLLYNEWSESDNDWKETQYVDYIYDSQKNVIQEDNYFKIESLDGEQSEWEYTDRYTYDYDKSILYSELATLPLQQYASQGHMANKPVKMEYQPSYIDWDTEYQQLYYYSSLRPTGLTSFNNQSLQFYPNPATDLVRFETPSDFSGNGTVEIFNMQGMKVFSSTYQNNRFSVAGLEKGMYQVKVSNLQNNYSEKLIVR